MGAEKLLKIAGFDPAKSIDGLRQLLATAEARLSNVEAHTQSLPAIAESLGVMVQHITNINGALARVLDTVDQLSRDNRDLRAELGKIRGGQSPISPVPEIIGEKSEGLPNGHDHA